MYFRTDMNETIASGHVMRCLAIADGYRRRGEKSTFIVCDEKTAEFIRNRGYEVILLDNEWNRMEDELDTLKELIEVRHIEKIIVDSYSVTGHYLRELNKITSVIYIDDTNACKYPVDVIISYGNWIQREEYIKTYRDCNTRLMLGTEYVPLRYEFTGYHSTDKEYDVLITTGGTDTYDIAGKLMKEIGEHHPEWRTIIISLRLTENTEYPNISVRGNVTNMAEIMGKSRIAVSASGTTLFELCAMKIPTVCFSFADNQVAFAQTMGETGTMIYSGDARENKDIACDIVAKLENLMYNKMQREMMINKMNCLVDGRGVDRIIDEIEGRG